ncbi:MAG: peptide-methionine (S)-S-oxide reductase MsrA [Myxococcales bacterium]|nr:peptide-methionine (S)-S-oxide reductase MsrA [Myxococcales bacterium]
MTRASLLGLLGAALLACSSSSSDTPTTAPADPAPADGEAGPEDPQAEVTLAYFAGGCFWGVEHYMEQLDGVLGVESGYMGGHVEEPSYQQVASQTSGHLETVRVRFDARRIGYEAVAKRFFEIHDPTQADGQGPDRGPEYLSAVFYTDAEQKRIAEGLIERLRARGYDVVTELRQADRFWPAEEYHQDYYVRKGTEPYCHGWVDRFGTGK